MIKQASFILLLAVGLFLGVQGLSGPALYIYSDSGVYEPGTYVYFRVLALDADSSPAAELNVYVTVYKPDDEVLTELEGTTDSAGWFIFSVLLENEGVYRLVVEADESAFGTAETLVLVCSGCPRYVETTTITNTITTTIASTTITTVIRNTVTTTWDRTTTLTAVLTTTTYSTQYSTTTRLFTTTVFETRVVQTTVVSNLVSTVREVLTTVLPGQTITQFTTSVTTRDVTVVDISTRTVVVSQSDNLLTPLALVAVVLTVLASVVVYAVRSGRRGY
ncbi:MAG: MG2 domain-containing protein [Candidatus Caldarchaeum sp.]|nr:MG2 domain-containing protein [Candidatus Caldarchaeum sp.]MCS7137638.1 MG2 domain-containing protein [Candidatus Caldarchaeum sp.]MDW7978747.1 MG2 domain-containing protein [Candidatus Caldarchaeum sp.]MDW8359144.1 MG2 domain-containing protein [Candidatus Caldarchaeum sp.]